MAKRKRKSKPLPLPKRIPAMLRELRAREGLSQRGAAIKCDVAQSLWCRWEGGQRLPEYATLQQIARAFGVQVELTFGP